MNELTLHNLLIVQSVFFGGSTSVQNVRQGRLLDCLVRMMQKCVPKKEFFFFPAPFIPLKISLPRVNPLKGLGHRDEPFRMEHRVDVNFELEQYLGSD